MSAISKPEQRIIELLALRDRIDAELRRCERLLAERPRVRRSRHIKPPCNTEEGYQWHRHRRQECEACAAAHREHNREDHARRRARQLLAGLENVA